jgi:hypothetical protein
MYFNNYSADANFFKNKDHSHLQSRRNLKKYYWQMPSCFKLIQLLSVRNIKELNNLGKYLLLAEKNRNA